MMLRVLVFLFLLIAVDSHAQTGNAILSRPACETIFDSTLHRTYYKFVDEPATYKGGNDSLMRTLQKNLRYPPIDRDGFEGTVWVSFIVEADGTTSNIRLVKKVTHAYYNEEALRAAKLLKAWNPGKCNGVAVATLQYLPIRFVLQ